MDARIAVALRGSLEPERYRVGLSCDSASHFLFEHDLFGKPVPTFLRSCSRLVELPSAGRAREIIAAHFNRPSDKAVAARHAAEFPDVRLVTVEDVFGGWQKVSAESLADGGILDKIYVNR